MTKHYLLILGMALCFMQGYAQSSRKSHTDFDSDFESFRKSIHADFEDFRQQIVEDYLDFLRNPWKEKEGEKPVPKPQDDPVPVVPYVPPVPKEDPDTVPSPTPVVIEEVIVPPVDPTPPTPVIPIDDDNDDDNDDGSVGLYSFELWGTPMQVHLDASLQFRVKGCEPEYAAKAIGVLLGEDYDPLFADCLHLRSEHALCDWAYLQLLQTIADGFCGKDTDEAEVMTAALMARSGYAIRLATDYRRLYMLFACQQLIYDKNYFSQDGLQFFALHPLPDRMSISDAHFDGEKQISLLIGKNIKLSPAYSEQRTITSERYPNVRIASSVNRNIINFYDTYPTCQWDDNFVTRWAMYANTPLDEHVKTELYPQFRQVIAGKSKLEAANILLNWVQTGFEYEYDDKVWGHDRTFFAEESIFYPYCDCEDRSILFSRLVRDLLDLPCILVYYPGHLATAVHFDTDVTGDYILLEGKRYTVSDPTYIGAFVGETMRGMDNSRASVILLK